MEDAFTSSATPDGYGAVLRRRLRLIVLVVAVGAPLLLLAVQVVTPTSYEARTTLLLSSSDVDPAAGLSQSANQVNVATERQVAQSTTVARRAAEMLGRDDAPRDVVEQLTVEAAGDTALLARGGQQVLHLTFEAADPELAADYVEAIGRAYLGFREQAAQEAAENAIESIDTQIAGLEANLAELLPSAGADGTSVRVQLLRDNYLAQMNDLESRKSSLLLRNTSPGEVISPATVPREPAGPPAWLNHLGALGLVGILAVATALAVDRRDRHVRGREELAEVAGPVLSVIEPPDDSSQVLPEEGSRQAEAYRHLAIRLASTSRRRLARVLFVAPRGDGASDVALALAAAVADLGDRALLVPCEFDHTPLDALSLPVMPSFDRSLVEQEIDETVDVSSSSRRESRRSRGADLAEKAIVPAPGVADLWVAPGGIGVTRTGVLTSFTAMLDAADEWFDSVLVSGPPVLELPNSLELSCIVDGVVLVLDPATVDRDDLIEAVDLLTGTSSELLLGTVVVTKDLSRWA